MERCQIRSASRGQEAYTFSKITAVFVLQERSLFVAGRSSAPASVSGRVDISGVNSESQQFCPPRNWNGLGRIRCGGSYIPDIKPSKVIDGPCKSRRDICPSSDC